MALHPAADIVDLEQDCCGNIFVMVSEHYH